MGTRAGAYDRNFEQHLVNNYIYPPNYRYPDDRVPPKPNNWKELNEILTKRRGSLASSEFSDEEYETFVQIDADSCKEKQVSDSVLPIIEGKITNRKCRAGGIPFNNFASLTDRKLKPGNPDIYYGARPEQLTENIRMELDDQIIPSTQDNLPMVPNFVVAVKGPDGSVAVAKRQACYDGALGSRAMHSLESYGLSEPVYGNNASTITSTYHNGHLQMYTSHLTQPKSPGGRPEYHMTQLKSFAMTGSVGSCRDGLRAYRNGREWCAEKRNDAINQANERAELEAQVPADEGITNSTLVFHTAAPNIEASTISQESRMSLNEDTHIPRGNQESNDLIEGFANHILPVEGPRRRRCTEVSGGANPSNESAIFLISQAVKVAEQSKDGSGTGNRFQDSKSIS
jgi:hypothetical protein